MTKFAYNNQNNMIKSADTLPLKTAAKLPAAHLQVNRLTALWALSESALGGLLHAFNIPFTGLLINSSAIIFMVMIAAATNKKGWILRATLIVIIVKGIVSPYTPLTAYLAVAFQGAMGELLLRSRKHLLLPVLLLGIITLFQSAIQKIIILTVVYGKALWESIDIFGNFVLSQLSFLIAIDEKFRLSIWLISAYIGIHLLAGIGIGLLSARLPVWIKDELDKRNDDRQWTPLPRKISLSEKKKRGRWIRKPTTIAVLLLTLVMVAGSYFFPEISTSQGMRALIMILRATAIMVIWYYLFGPLFLKIYKKFINRKQNTYAGEVQETIEMLPALRYIIYRTWQKSAGLHGFKRIKSFLVNAFVSILTAEF
jgi:hypothetical protein